MAKDLKIMVAHEPGSLAHLGEVLGAAGVNIDGMCAVTSGGQGEIHFLVEDAEAAKAALTAEGVGVDAETEVLVLEIENRPGALGETARRMAKAGVNITLAYLAFPPKLVFAVDDMAAARMAME